jgi:hypothetical protein
MNGYPTSEGNMAFTNAYVLSKIAENASSKQIHILHELHQVAPLLPADVLLQLYTTSISIHQSKVQGNGNFLENEIVVKMLDAQGIPYRQQVTINSTGRIVGFHTKKEKCYHIIDFVVGKDIDIGKPISEYTVISCKTTCRERWTQDDWTYTFPPKKYILLTISDDYPLTTRFREDANRKIITCLPKKKDDRKYKLNFEDLYRELQIF